MKGHILAKRYAKALLDLGQEEKALDRLQEEISRAVKVFEMEPHLLKFLSLKEFSPEKKERLLEGLGRVLLLSPWMKKLLQLLVRRGKISLFPLVAEAFQGLVREEENQVVAKIQVAQAKSLDAVRASLREALEKMTGKKVAFEIKEEPDLLGGLQIRLGDKIYDASLAGELERIKQEWM